MTKKLFIVDAMAMAFRNFHAFGQRQLQTAAGEPTSVIYGSAQFMLKLLKKKSQIIWLLQLTHEKKHFAITCMTPIKPIARICPKTLQFSAQFFELFAAMNIPVLKLSGMEADDLIGSLVTQLSGPELHCYIVSGDKDFMQLVSPYVYMYAPKKQKRLRL